MQAIKSALVPRSVLELIDRTFRIFRDNFIPLIGATALITIPVTLLNLVSTLLSTRQLDIAAFNRNPAYGSSSSLFALQALAGASGLGLGLVVLNFIQGVLLDSILTYMASEYHLGRRTSVGKAFRVVRSRWLALAGAKFLFYIALFGLSFVTGITLICAFGIVIPLAAYLLVTLNAFINPVLSLERVGSGTGLNRAWMLAKSRFWAVFSFTALVGGISLLLQLGLLLVELAFIQNTIGGASFNASTFIRIVAEWLITLFLLPLPAVGFVVLYYDSRVRLEGLDIALKSVAVPEPRPADVPSPLVSTAFFDRRDLVNLGIMYGVSIGIVAVSYGLISLLASSLR